MSYRYETTDEWIERVKDLRRSSGKTLRDFCYILGGVVSPSTLCRIERGEQRCVSSDLILVLSNYAGCDFTPVTYKCDSDLQKRIDELNKENRMLRDYIRMKWHEEEINGNG